MTDTTQKTDMTVNQHIARHPASVEIFNRLGIDACCGGDVPPREAALRDGVDVELLMKELEAVTGGLR